MALLIPPIVQKLAHFVGLLPMLIGWLLFVTATMGPSLIPNTSLSIFQLGPISGQRSSTAPSGAWLGVWGSCYQIAGGEKICTATSDQPNYNQTLNALNAAGLPALFTSQIPDHLKLTTRVQIVGAVFIFFSALCMIPALLAAHIPYARWSPSRLLSPNRSKFLFGTGIFFLFWGYLFALTASLAQNDQFADAASTFNQIASVRGSLITNADLARASVGSTFIQQWVAYAFIGFSVLISEVIYLKWPTNEESYWSSKQTTRSMVEAKA